MKLHYRILGEGQPMVILHGLFGFSDNWQTHAKKFAEFFKVILVDLRNHGHSPWSDEFSYPIMANDLKELLDDLKAYYIDDDISKEESLKQYICDVENNIINYLNPYIQQYILNSDNN